MCYHQFSFEFLCLQGLGNIEVLFSLTKQHPFLSLCCRERWFPCLYLKKEEKLLTKTANRFITLLKSFRSISSLDDLHRGEKMLWRSQRWMVLVSNLLVRFCITTCCWLGWVVQGKWKHVSSMLVSCSIFSVTRLYSPVLCSSFCFPLPPKGETNVYYHDVLCLAGTHKNFCSSCLHFWLRYTFISPRVVVIFPSGVGALVWGWKMAITWTPLFLEMK